MTLRLSLLCALFASSGWLVGYYMSGQRSSHAPSATPAYGIGTGSQTASTDERNTTVVPRTKSSRRGDPRATTAPVEENYEQALQSALADRNPVRRAHLLYAIASKLDPGQIPAALANAQKMTS